MHTNAGAASPDWVLRHWQIRRLQLTDRRAISAADVALRHRLAMADAVMYSMAIEHDATFWTQDVDYQGLPSVNCFPKR